ncbi:hypothetical protein [Paenibacillus sp. FJAT-26967]|uniref:hypothetical protein n=1 Tax=Paenibacillus sp. FJAT-26967 TaxID=1729690 RepID=UPI000AF0DA0B|nr:hypothetical protein [Paenibacillus sp. FJAT-26967]
MEFVAALFAMLVMFCFLLTLHSMIKREEMKFIARAAFTSILFGIFILILYGL